MFASLREDLKKQSTNIRDFSSQKIKIFELNQWKPKNYRLMKRILYAQALRSQDLPRSLKSDQNCQILVAGIGKAARISRAFHLLHSHDFRV